MARKSAGMMHWGCRFELRIIVNTVLSSVDLAWLEKALESNGLLHRAKLLDLTCVDAEMYNTLQQARLPFRLLSVKQIQNSAMKHRLLLVSNFNQSQLASRRCNLFAPASALLL